MSPAELVAGLLDLVVGIAASATREHQESILRQVEALHGRVLHLPSLSADVRSAVERRRTELRDEDTKPMAVIPPERPR